MTEKTPPRVQVLAYLRTHGDSKASAVQRGTGMSETTARKWLTTLVNEGAVLKVGQHYQVLHADDLVGKSNGKPRKAREAGTRRDPDVSERDELVYCHLLNHLNDDGTQHATRNEVAQALGLSSSHAYLSLWRLARAGRITQVGTGTREPGWVAAKAE